MPQANPSPGRFVSRIIKAIFGMNAYDDSTSLQSSYVRLVQNMTPKKTSLDTREGWTKYNSSVIPGTVGVYGVAYYSPAVGTDLELAVCNGKLYSGSAGVFTERYSLLSTTTLCTIVQFDNIAIIADQVNRMVAYKYGDAVYQLGIESPKEFKLIDSFENATDWSMTNGSAANDQIHQIYGTQCVAFTSVTGDGVKRMIADKTLGSVLDLTVFNSGATATTSEYISIYLIRGTYLGFSDCYIELGDSSFANYFRYNLASMTDWTGTSAPNVAFELKVRKSLFTTGAGSPVWTNIQRVRLNALIGNGQVGKITCDFNRLEKTGPIPADSGSAGNLNGTYWYRVTYMTSDGWESDPSLTSVSVTVTDHSVNLTLIPVPGSTRIAEKKIYRLGGSSAEWRLLTILYDASVTTYTDNTDEVNLGDIQDEVEGYPYIPKTICRHDRCMVIANLTDLDGTRYPCGIMVSKEESIDIYDHLDFFEIEPNMGAEIKWIISALDFIYVGKNESIWKFDPKDLTLPPRNISRIYGGAGPLAVCVGENEFYFLDGGKQGIVSFNGSYAEIISDSSTARGSSVKNYIDNIPTAYLSSCWMLYYSQFVLVGLPQGTDTYPTLVLAYYVPRRFWFTIAGWNARCGYSAKISGVNTLHLGFATNGYVYNAFSGDTDDGTAISSVIQTADDDFDSPEVRKDFAKLILWAKKLTATDATLNIEPYLDTADTTKDVPATITSLTGQRIELGVPELGYKGSHLGLRISSSQRWSFRALAQWARLEPPPVGQ